MALHDLWMTTEGDRALPWLINGVEWVFSMTDEALPEGFAANVITDWGPPKKTQRMSLSETGYARSPCAEMGPGWCRYIGIGNGEKGFRPEILASGTIGLAIAMFMRDAGDSICGEHRERWIEHLARLFEWHAPNWQDEHTHPDGDHFGVPHSGLKVAAYCWPKGIGPEPDGNIPGLNQQVQFLVMGTLVEEMSGRDIGAKTKLKLFCERTLPHLIKEDERGRLFTAYDLRAHAQMDPYNAEPTNDGNHFNKSAVLFIEAARLGFIPVEYQDKLIKTILEVTHLGDGQMAILQDGTSEHEGGNRQKNCGIEHIVGALMFENGDQLLDLAETVLAREMPQPGGHKSMCYHAQFQRAKAFHAGKLPDTGRVIDPAKPDQKPDKKPLKAHDKKKAQKKPAKKSDASITTEPMTLTMGSDPVAIVDSIGARAGYIESRDDRVVDNPTNWDDKNKVNALMLTPVAVGECVVGWHADGKRYETLVTVADKGER